MTRLLDNEALERSTVVANRDMRRDRGLTGRDGYLRNLGIDPVTFLAARPGPARWLDLCCGSGTALIEAATQLGALPGLEIIGVDLVGFFASPAPPAVRFVTGSVSTWRPAGDCDLITCVHGLHYLGDKLAVLTEAAAWLRPGGVFVANFDAAGIRHADGKPAGRRLTAALREAGFAYDARNRRIRRAGPGRVTLPFRYLGADPEAGPNYTGQPAVHSYYELRPHGLGPTTRARGG